MFGEIFKDNLHILANIIRISNLDKEIFSAVNLEMLDIRKNLVSALVEGKDLKDTTIRKEIEIED